MKRVDNLFKLHRRLRDARVPIPTARLLEELECSVPTLHRLVRDLRNGHSAPLEYRRDHPEGYIYTNDAYELGGIWHSPEEVQSLLTIQHLLKSFHPGLLDKALEPQRRKLDKILRSQGLSTDSGTRIRLLRIAGRPPGPCFDTVAAAVLQRRCLHITYTARSTRQTSERDVSPQRLTHYRDNWYLDAWCHRQQRLRTFAVDCISRAKMLDDKATDIDEAALDQELGSSYGIFAGPPTGIAKLLFTANRAPWVSSEQWHPQQKGQFLDSGEYLLEFPYGRSEELVLDILRYGPDVEVLEPLELRQEVIARLRAALGRYE